jgi:hypothetical protein
MSMYKIIFMSDISYTIVVFARRISMHKSLNGNEYMHITIGWFHDLNNIVFYNRTSTYNLSCLVCFVTTRFLQKT